MVAVMIPFCCACGVLMRSLWRPCVLVERPYAVRMVSLWCPHGVRMVSS